ncbi:MAG: TldD/PmbA family protein [bacterium]
MLEKINHYLKNRAESAELFMTDAKSTPVVFKANQLYSVETANSTGFGLRVISNGRVGFSSTNKADNMKALAENALESARFGELSCFELPALKELPVVKTIDEKVMDFEPDKGVELGTKIISILRQKCPDLIADIDITWGKSNYSIYNTSGCSLKQSMTSFSLSVVGNKVDENGILWVDDGHYGCDLNLEFDSIVENISRRVKDAERITRANSPDSVLFMPQALPSLVSGFMAGLNGKTLQKGSSPLKGRIGEKILDNRLTFSDDPTLEFMSGSYAFDDEGMPGSAKKVIERGVLKDFIFDLQTAGIMKTKSTGNGQRGYSSVPAPGFSNFVISPGQRPVSEIQKNIKNGIVVYGVLGGGQSNMLAGDFSLNLHLAYKVENGEITGRVKDTMISGNIYDVFNQIIEISSDYRKEGSFLLPAVLFDKMSISG